MTTEGLTMPTTYVNLLLEAGGELCEINMA